MSQPFTHLHVHTQYSMLDGAIRIGDLIEKTKEYGMNAVAVTDHGAMYGALEFYTKAKKAGLRPIIGCELYIAETDHLIHDKSAGHNFHLVLLAMNEDGYRNLMKLASVAQTAGFYYKPRIDRKLLASHHEGLIALSACLHGEVPWLISHSGMDAARQKALELQQLFGDRLYFEVQENGIPEQTKVNVGLQELGNDLGIKLVATNDCHYLNKDEAYAHEVLLCIQTSKVISDPGRFKFSTDELYFKPPDVMARQFSWCPEALSNTMEVAERCDLKLKFGENHFPIFPVPAGESLESLFEHACRDGLEQRLALLRELQEVSPELEAQYRERLEMEIKVIQKMGFAGYFLIVADFINWAKSKGIPVGPGRGCVTPDTKVLLADGREAEIQDVTTTDQVVTHLGNVFPVRKTMAYDCEEELVQIEAANETLSLTQDHKVWAVRSETCTVDSAKTRSVVCKPTCPRFCSQAPCDQYRPEWIPAGQLRKNDFVVFPRTASKNKEIVFDLLDFVERKPNLIADEDSLCYVIGTNRIPTKKLPRYVPFDENLAKLLGYYIAEGWSRLGERRCGIGFGLHKKETAYADELQHLLQEIFGLDSKIVHHKTRNSLQVIAHSKIAGEFLTSLCGKGANQKHIPFQLVSHGKDELLKTLIAYMFRGDGHDGACNATISIKYSTTSPVLASQLRLLLARFGYWATLLRREKERWATEFSVKLAGRQLLQWNKNFPAFPIEQGQQCFYRNDSFYADGRYIYLKIRSISRMPYQGKVYDISVPPDTSYVANSMAIHNSGAGSLAAYCMAITDIDPIPYGLLFERFLNVERVSMPDFDVDFCKDRRDEVIDYVRQRYGGDAHVAQIVAYGSMKARAVLRDVGRVLEIPLPQVDRIAKLVPEELKITLKKAIDQEPRLRDAMREESIQKLLKVAQTLEGLARHKSTHAAGVVISPKPMVEYLPVCIGPDKEILTQYDMKYTEMTGLIKFDFLGLKTLTVIDRALKLIKQDIGLEVQLSKIPTDDQKTYDLLCAGSSLGVFQLESDGMRELLIKMAPEQFTDLIALVALYRPGPLDSGMVDQFVETKHGRRPAEYPVPQIKEVLRETYGVIVYQEQVMKISNILASYSLGDADILRRAMGKKIPEEMEKERGKFMAGAKVNGIPEERAAYVFDLMAKFAGYGFNKCIIGSTRLLDAETGELLTVEELHQQPRRFMVHALGEDCKLRPRKVLDVFENGRKPVFELRTAQGHRITATANHPFRTLNGWTLLGDLKPGDRIAAPRRLIVQGGTSWPRHELITLAGLLAEGNVCHPSSLYFFGNDAVIVQDFAEAAAPFSESKARVYQRSDGRFEVCVNTGRDMRFGKKERNAEEEAAPPVRSGAWHWAERLGILGKKAVEKAVPPEVFLLADADIELFLGRLWAGDGFIASQDQFTPYYATSSPELARDVQTLLLRLGIPSGVHEKRFLYRGGVRVGYTVHVVGEDSAATFLARVAPHALGRERQAEQLRHHLEGKQPGLTSKDTIPAEVRVWVDEERRAAGLTWSELERRSGVCMKEFTGKGSTGKRGFRRSTLARLAGFFASSRLAEIAESDIFWDSVVSIEPRGEQQTYDLTVEEDHNFVADGLIVHNSHSAAYALVAYHTAYLKAHYPAQFLAALLSCDVDNTDKVVKYINECRQMSIEVLPPDINESYHDFTVIKDRIRFGLAAVKGVGGAALDSVIEERRKAPYTSLADFCGRVDSSRVNRKVLENLIKAGAFDSMRAKRAQLMEVLDKTIEQAKTVQRDRMSGQMSLFGMGGGAAKSGAGAGAEIKLPDVEEWAPLVKLGYEKETVGFFLTGHPLDGVIDHIRLVADSDLAAMESWKDGQIVRVGGLIQRFKEHRSKKGDRMAFTVLEDMTASVEVVVFPETFAKCSHLLGSEQPLIVQGSVQVSERGANIIADSVLPLNEALEQLMEKAVIRLRSDRVGRPQLTALKDLLYQFHGTLPIKITLHFDGRGEADIEPHPDMAVRPCADFFQQLRQHFGKDCLIVQTKKAEARKRKSEGSGDRSYHK